MGWLANARDYAEATELIFASGPKVLFSAKDNHCSPNFIPDSPARVFRRADGNLELIAAHFDDWMMVGKNFQSMKTSCHSIMPADGYGRTTKGHLWIQATYTEDGKHIYGLASQDLTTYMTACGCDSKVSPGHCWVNQILSVSSDNMGNDFKVGPVVASFGSTYPPELRWQFGFFSTTNIIRRGKFYYTMIFLTPAIAKQPSGDCLFRTSTPDDPLSWRGWDGADFTYKAYEKVSASNKYALVTFPEVGIIRCIQYVPKNDDYVAMSHALIKLPGEHAAVPGFYSLTSKDLIHWTDLKRVMTGPIPQQHDLKDIYSYPSLIDPESKSQNFDTLDHDTGVVFYTDHHLNPRYGSGTMNRDLIYCTLHIK